MLELNQGCLSRFKNAAFFDSPGPKVKNEFSFHLCLATKGKKHFHLSTHSQSLVQRDLKFKLSGRACRNSGKSNQYCIERDSSRLRKNS